MSHEFKPNYAIPPGETLQEILEEKKWSVQDFSLISQIQVSEVEGILNGEKRIDEETAYKMNKATGISRTFWLNLQKNYEAVIKRLEIEGKSLNREPGGRVTVID